uniref:Uncharacterized protein n=2 Tax=Ciona intestinalis TaxID=7719 RepID=F6VB34_CIOIN
LKMAQRHAVQAGGLFGASNTAPLSAGTKDLLKVMMEESKLTNFQRRALSDSLKKGKALPLKVAPTSSEREMRIESFPPPQKAFTMRGQASSSMRTRDEIEESGAYDRPQYVPKPIKSLDKEKERLSNIMAYGEDVKPKSQLQKLAEERQKMKELPRIDRFEEVEKEIEERKKFLEDMESAGQGSKYRPIIASQISLLIREMEMIDKERSKKLESAIMNSES